MAAEDAAERTPVRARAWCRADLAGGTLDIWPLGLLHPGARTVNVALGVPVEVRLAPRSEGWRVVQGESRVEAASLDELAALPETALPAVVAAAMDLPPVAIDLASGSPRGAGLAASSAMTVALIAAAEAYLGRDASSPAERVRTARDLEARLMSLPTGLQDHYPALLGGALEISYHPGGERVRRLDVDLEALGRSLLVVYSGVSHFSAGKNWHVVRRRLEADPETVELFTGIAETATELGDALEAGDLPRVGELVGREWGLRSRLADGVSTPELERLLEAARSLGAWGGKAGGAGGGGCLLILAPPEKREAIAARLEELGGRRIEAVPTAEPLTVER